MKQVEATIKEGEAQIGERFEELNLELTARLRAFPRTCRMRESLDIPVMQEQTLCVMRMQHECDKHANAVTAQRSPVLLNAPGRHTNAAAQGCALYPVRQTLALRNLAQLRTQVC